MSGGVPWHAGVPQGAKRSMTSWHKGEEEASLQRAIKRGDSGPKNSLDKAPINGTGVGRKETAREESKREEADRVAQYVVDEFQRLYVGTFLCGVLPPPPPFDIAFRLSLRIFFVSVSEGISVVYQRSGTAWTRVLVCCMSHSGKRLYGEKGERPDLVRCCSCMKTVKRTPLTEYE